MKWLLLPTVLFLLVGAGSLEAVGFGESAALGLLVLFSGFAALCLLVAAVLKHRGGLAWMGEVLSGSKPRFATSRASNRKACPWHAGKKAAISLAGLSLTSPPG